MAERSLLFSIESDTQNAPELLSLYLKRNIENSLLYKSDIFLLCIGTDRSTGDCLGPLVGYLLNSRYNLKGINILGTLKDPVHAKNLDNNIDLIFKKSSNPLIIAVDASLGKLENLGNINLYSGPILPGAGVNKNLTPVGDLSITGVVNISGFMEYMVLQNTRLSFVMDIAETISKSLYYAISNLSMACSTNI